MISICVPAYDMEGCGTTFLGELLLSIERQSYSDYEVIVSDDSTTPEIDYMCRSMGVTRIHGKPGAAANLNNAIAHAKGDIVKPMFQDDKFIDPGTLWEIEKDFVTGARWVACISQNRGDGYPDSNHIPYPHKSIERLRGGENTYGSPSAMAWHRNDLRFDENLKWLFDCEFYARMAEKYGVPRFLDVPVFIRQWAGQATYTMATGATRINDLNYVIEKYRDHGGHERFN